jgi:hypothetical protein
MCRTVGYDLRSKNSLLPQSVASSEMGRSGGSIASRLRLVRTPTAVRPYVNRWLIGRVLIPDGGDGSNSDKVRVRTSHLDREFSRAGRACDDRWAGTTERDQASPRPCSTMRSSCRRSYARMSVIVAKQTNRRGLDGTSSESCNPDIRASLAVGLSGMKFGAI